MFYVNGAHKKNIKPACTPETGQKAFSLLWVFLQTDVNSNPTHTKWRAAVIWESLHRWSNEKARDKLNSPASITSNDPFLHLCHATPLSLFHSLFQSFSEGSGSVIRPDGTPIFTASWWLRTEHAYSVLISLLGIHFGWKMNFWWVVKFNVSCYFRFRHWVVDL